MPNVNTNLNIARKIKTDEFYTQLIDIENELQHYASHFKNKIVYCNCDSKESNFTKYFIDNFSKLKIKLLICTTIHSNIKFVYDGISQHIENLKETGDFRSPECVELLKEADIVVTNPPFSLFREYVAQLMEYEKKFIIMGNINGIAYKEIFPFIIYNKIWLGASIHSGDREFRVPDSYPLNASGCRVDAEGTKYIRVKGVRWFTNLDYKERHDPIILYKQYSPEEYPKYDNYDAIEISKTSDIPLDYKGMMGVPITFMDKYCPEQFEIVGIAKRGAGDPKLRSKVYTKDEYANYSDLNSGTVLKNNNGTLKITYQRLLIKRKNQNP